MVDDIDDDELRNYFYVTLNGKIVRDWTTLKDNDNFHVHLRVLGGKGGFGSLLRSFRIHRSSNQLMCRDLSGRRLADVKEETKLKKWIAKAAEREADKEKKRKEKYERLKRGPPKHQFDDQDYLQLKDEILSTTDDAFEEGRQLLVKEKAQESTTTTSQPADTIDNSDTHIDKAKIDVDEELVCSSSSSSSNAAIVQQRVDVVRHHQQSTTTTTKITKKQKRELEKEKKPIADEKSFAEINLDDFESAFELEALGMDQLKCSLEVRGLKCGGTLKERAERLFSVQGLSSDQYPKSIIATAKKTKQ